MRCEEIENDLSALIDGELERETRAAVEAHVGACADCARLCRDLRRVRDLVDAEIGAARGGAADAVMRAVDPPARLRGAAFARAVRRWAGGRRVRAAAAALIAAGLAGVVLLRREQPSAVDGVVAATRGLLDSVTLACLETGRGISAAPESVASEARSVWLAFAGDVAARRFSEVVGRGGEAVPSAAARASSVLGGFLESLPDGGGADGRRER